MQPAWLQTCWPHTSLPFLTPFSPLLPLFREVGFPLEDMPPTAYMCFILAGDGGQSLELDHSDGAEVALVECLGEAGTMGRVGSLLHGT